MNTPIKLYEVKIRDYSKKDVEQYKIYETTIRKAWKKFQELNPQKTNGYKLETVHIDDKTQKEKATCIMFVYPKEVLSCITITELKVVSGNGR